jgi:hypothetical protein
VLFASPDPSEIRRGNGVFRCGPPLADRATHHRRVWFAGDGRRLRRRAAGWNRTARRMA